MWKMFAIVTAGLVMLSSAAVGAADTPLPDFKGGRRLPRDYVRKTIVVEIQGKLVVIYPPCGTPPLTDPMVQVTVNGKTYWLDFSSYRELLDKAEKLNGKAVAVKGSLQGDTVTVTALKGVEKTEEFIKETVQVEIQGKLDEIVPDVKFPMPGIDDGLLLPPWLIPSWTITVNGQQYTLDFDGNKELLKTARLLKGQRVVLTGTLEPVFELKLAIDDGKAPLCPLPVVRVTSMAPAELGL